MSALIFIILSLAVWRMSKMLTEDSGPYDVIEKFRNSIINEPWSPLHCLQCTSLWVSFVFTFLLNLSLIPFFLTWLAASALAILINEILEWCES